MAGSQHKLKVRLFIGNLSSSVSGNELREKFDSLLQNHQNEAVVGDAEVRCKNENNYFGFVDVHFSDIHGVAGKDDRFNLDGGGGHKQWIPLFLRKYIDLMNNTKWKGNLIKVQLAKENFMERLKKEQEARRSEAEQQEKALKEDKSEQGMNKRQAMDILKKMNSRERSNRWKMRNGDQNEEEGGQAKAVEYDFEIVGRNQGRSSLPPEKGKPVASPQKERKEKKKKRKDSSSEDSEEDEVRDGIPKFKGLLLSYPDGPPATSKPVVEEKREKSPEKIPDIQKKLLEIAFDKQQQQFSNKRHVFSKASEATAPAPVKSAINFKKGKQEKSDLLRLQSMEKRKELKNQRQNLIKSSLSSVTVSAPVTEQRKTMEYENEKEKDKGPEVKKSKMTLFDEDDDDDDKSENNDNSDEFGVKKQYEGKSGQRLLELKTRWGGDDRFKIDDRFKDDKEENLEPTEQEKEKQLSILTHILGREVTTSKSSSAPAKSKKDPVILPRYDPEAEEEEETVEPESKSKKKKKGAEETEAKSKSDDAKAPEPIRSTEPATFKTVSNLKALFSSGGGEDDASTTENGEAKILTQQVKFNNTQQSQQSSSFSLLAAFGKADEDNDDDEMDILKGSTKVPSKNASSSAPRSFWQSNPFKYDSSDDEDDDKKVKVTIKKSDADATTVPASKPGGLLVHGKMPFFFTYKDPRFEGLEDFFLQKDEVQVGEGGEEGVQKKEDFSEKRQELKSIVKAKIRNTKRKDEKRTLAIKRAIRKRKRKLQKTSYKPKTFT